MTETWQPEIQTTGSGQETETSHKEHRLPELKNILRPVREIVPRGEKGKEALRGLVEELNRDFDYEALFEYYKTHKSEDDNGVDFLTNAVNELYYLRWCTHEIQNPSGRSHGNNFYEYNYRILGQYKEEWGRMGFLHEQNTQELAFQPGINVEYGEQAKFEYEQLLRELKTTVEEIKRFNVLVTTYGSSSQSNLIYDRMLSGLLFALRAPEYGSRMGYKYEDFDEVGFDPGLIGAARQFFYEILREYESSGFILPGRERDIRPEVGNSDNEVGIGEILKQIQFSGFEPPKGMIAVITPQEIFDKMAILIPPDILRSLRSISRENPVEGDETLGLCDSDSEGAYIKILDYLFVEPDILESGKTGLALNFMRILWHELGHVVHSRMSYAEILDWEEATQGDVDTDISWYVRCSRSAGYKKRKRENFAESFMFFLTNPAILETISPKRFEFMNSFFHGRLSAFQIPKFDKYIELRRHEELSIWQKSGLTPDKIREIYLLPVAQEK